MGLPPSIEKVVWSIKLFIGMIVGRIVPIRIPKVVHGKGCLSDVGQMVKNCGKKKPLIVASGSAVRNGAVKICAESFAQLDMQHAVFDSVTPDPVEELVEQGFAIYKQNGCDSIVAIGGGSPLDCAKVIAAKAGNPQPVEKYEGFLFVSLFGIYGTPAPIVAVPTTAGSGSETTLAAVISLKAKGTKPDRKISIMDHMLVPKVAILDPSLMTALPPAMTAATGMDAMTHAVESFLSTWSNAYTRKYSIDAVEKICASLTTAWSDGNNIEARMAMLQASFDAGVAFTRASVGYVHAIAHQFGAMYHTPHGAANAMLLPFVLDFYLRGEEAGSDISNHFFELSVAAGLAPKSGLQDAESKHGVARRFVQKIRDMNKEMNMVSEVAELKASDVPKIVKRAMDEAQGTMHNFGTLKYTLDLGYPVPKVMSAEACAEIVASCLPAAEQKKWNGNRER